MIHIEAFITDSKTVAIVYFSISLVVLIACVLSLYCLTQIEFFKYYVYKGKLTRQVEHASRPSLEQFMQTIKGCWAQLVSVFLVFFVTLAVFPTILAGITPNNKGQQWSREIYYGITVFLNFNLLAAIGSTTANFIQIPGPNLLLVPVSARLLFIPFFMLCNYNVDDRVMPVYFENEWYFIIGNAIMAFTSGYFSSLAMMYAPRVVPGSLSKTAGMIAALFLVTGAC
ncbi:nucleoside transporter [Cooperia oncophora]